MTDQQIRDKALNQFASFALLKFNKGIEEHNPNGDKGLWNMSEIQLIRALKEEAADNWFYLNTLEQKFLSASAETENPEI